MRKLLFSCFLFLYSSLVNAQDSTRFSIKADQLVADVLTPAKLYQYPEFTKGRIYFRDKTFVETRLNYNYLNGEVEFIKMADTLAIEYDQMLNIDRIVLNTDTFYCYDKGYVQLLSQTSTGKILQQKSLVVLRRDKIGAFGQKSNTTRSESLEFFRDYFGSTSVTSMRAPEDITMGYVTKYYFGDKYATFLPANKKNLMRLFSSKESTINQYLKANEVDYKKADDLKSLLNSIE